MAAPGKQSSRWGSFLQQAVAGVEARLDTILADDDAATTTTQPAKEAKPAPVANPPRPASPATASSRPASTNRANDRLQERLARAMAAKSAGKADASASRPSVSSQGSPRQSIDTPARASSESADRPSLTVTEPTSPRASQEAARKSKEGASPASPAGHGATNGDEKTTDAADEDATIENPAQPSAVVVDGMGKLSQEDQATGPSAEAGDQTTLTGSEEENRVKELEKALEEARLQYQEETHSYVERIDALEAKLQFLAREASDAARKAALEAPAGSLEKKVAEKDQQIAQLMEEGKNLASTEQKHRLILKKLRTKAAEDEKELNTLKTAKVTSDRELETLRKRARRADELEKTHDDLRRKLDASQRELNTLRPEAVSKDDIIADLRSQLKQAKEQVEAATSQDNEQAREQDRRRIAELEESVAALQVEKNLVADRAKNQVNDWKEKAERASERTKALELELKAEVQAMESKLEVMRIRAEEASSGAMGDSQAKLLRQVETLQTQYSIASENWQGIEATLLSRITNMERERDEAQQRESDMRKKAREAAVRAKRTEEELEELKTKINANRDAKPDHAQVQALSKRAEEAEAALTAVKAELERQRQAWKEDKEEKQSRPPSGLTGDRRGWLEDLHNGSFRGEPLPLKIDSRPESPLLSPPPRTFSADLLGIQTLPNKLRKLSGPSSNSDGMAGSGTLSRRPSALTSRAGGASFSPIIDQLATPSVAHSIDREREDPFEGVETGSNPQQVMHDMVSVSTVAAGPSVQLVERMSAAIRRLESEKVAAREELSRISKQRDEARAEIVVLMRDAESGKAALKRVTDLEAEVADVNARYETTLEMLGEKSEMVEELRADVEDVKAMYRDLVERTVR